MQIQRIDQRPLVVLLLTGLLGLAVWVFGLNQSAHDPDLDQPAWSGGENGLRPSRPKLHLHVRASDILTPSEWIAQANP